MSTNEIRATIGTYAPAANVGEYSEAHSAGAMLRDGGRDAFLIANVYPMGLLGPAMWHDLPILNLDLGGADSICPTCKPLFEGLNRVKLDQVMQTSLSLLGFAVFQWAVDPIAWAALEGHGQKPWACLIPDDESFTDGGTGTQMGPTPAAQAGVACSDHKWPAERACPEVVSDAGLCTDDFAHRDKAETVRCMLSATTTGAAPEQGQTRDLSPFFAEPGHTRDGTNVEAGKTILGEKNGMVDLVTLYDGGVFLGTPMGRCFEVERESGMYILFGLKQDVRYMLTLGESRAAAAARAARAFYSAYTPPAAIWPLNDATRSWNVVASGDAKARKDRREDWIKLQPKSPAYASNYVDVPRVTCPEPFDGPVGLTTNLRCGFYKDLAMAPLDLAPTGAEIPKPRFSASTIASRVISLDWGKAKKFHETPSSVELPHYECDVDEEEGEIPTYKLTAFPATALVKAVVEGPTCSNGRRRLRRSSQAIPTHPVTPRATRETSPTRGACCCGGCGRSSARVTRRRGLSRRSRSSACCRRRGCSLHAADCAHLRRRDVCEG